MKKSDLPEFQWTPVCQEGFDQLKKALTEAPVLAHPDYSNYLFIYCGNGRITQRFRCSFVPKRG